MTNHRPLRPALTCALALAIGCGSSAPALHRDADAGHADAGLDSKAAEAEAGPLPPLCSVTSAGSGPAALGAVPSGGLVLAGLLLLPAGPTAGELFIAPNGTIACAAASCATTAGYASAAHVVCAGGVISPALVNAHDHTEYATVPPQAHGTIRYECRDDWRIGEEGAVALPTVPETSSVAIMAAQELRLVLGGGLSIVGTGGVEGLARNLAEYTDAKELGGLTGDTVFFDTFPLGDQNGLELTSGCGYPDVISAGEAFSDGVFAPHIAEGINLAAENELHCASAATNDLVTKRTSIIHGVAVNATDVAAVAAAGAGLIWSPRSNVSLYGDTAPLTEYRRAGVPIALGTDWLPSGSMNMLRELACADAFNTKYFAGTFSDADLFAMATVNAANAAGFGDQIGSLTPGLAADVVVFDGRANAGYRAVVAGAADDVHLVLRGGAAIYGDAAIVGALASGCTALSVCGNARDVCFDVPGITLADAMAAGEAIYPLFACAGQTPPDEPTCVPYRDTYPDGTSATDGDGDGVPDATDDCPTVFNAIRPMDDGKQSDVDGDGYGDVCDAQPTNPAAH